MSTGATAIKIGVKLGRISIIRDEICSQKLQHASSHAATGRCVAFACAQLIMSVMAASGVSKRLRKSLDMLALHAGSMCELALAQAVPPPCLLLLLELLKVLMCMGERGREC